MSNDASSLPYVALLLVVVGWFVANSQANKRESRKEARALIDDSRKRIIQIAEDSLKYQCEGRTELAVFIKSSLDVLEVDLERIPNFKSGSPLMGRLVAFQDAVTGDDFETAAPQRRSITSAQVAEVLRARNALLLELERQYRVYYL